MPAKLDLFTLLRRRNGCPFPGTRRLLQGAPSAPASTLAMRRKHKDPYYLAQARARKAVNASRQAVLRTERSKALGDPVRGISAPFLESFDSAEPPKDDPVEAAASAAPQEPVSESSSLEASTEHGILNHFITKAELDKSLEHSRGLSAPWHNPNRSYIDPAAEDRADTRHEMEDENAREALRRITSLENSSAKDRLRVNVQRCINTFGRHNTDSFLRPKPAAFLPPEHEATATKLERTPRAGPDTGSSEVQAAILTAKIRGLANFLDTRGKKDAQNARNLRLLVHKRQKVLKYLRKKERGGQRWQFLIKSLGLTEATWKGEITL